jgi:hypothetical protein
MHLFGLRATALAVILVWIMTDAFAQQDTAALRITVKDTSGGAIVGSKVTVLDRARGSSRIAMTNNERQAFFLSLSPSLYEVLVEASRFAKYVASDIQLKIGQLTSYPPCCQ